MDIMYRTIKDKELETLVNVLKSHSPYKSLPHVESKNHKAVRGKAWLEKDVTNIDFQINGLWYTIQWVIYKYRDRTVPQLHILLEGHTLKPADKYNLFQKGLREQIRDIVKRHILPIAHIGQEENS